MSGHTSGEWRVELDVVDEGDIGVFGPDMVAIALVDCRDDADDVDSVPREEALANAYVMAAAPELLEAAKLDKQAEDFECRHAVVLCDCGDVQMALVQRARDARDRAIAKAEAR